MPQIGLGLGLWSRTGSGLIVPAGRVQAPLSRTIARGLAPAAVLARAGSGVTVPLASTIGVAQVPTISPAPAAAAVAFNYIDRASDSANASTHTFTDFPTGTSASGDKIIVCVGSWNSGSTTTGATACTVGGNAASKVNHAGIYDGSLFTSVGDVYVIDAPGDGAQTIVVTHGGSGNSNGVDILVLRAFLPGGNTPTDTAAASDASTSDPLAAAIDKVANGGVLAFSCRSRPAGAARPATFDAAFTELHDGNYEQNVAIGVHHVTTTAADVAVSVEYSVNDNARNCMWTAWGPA